MYDIDFFNKSIFKFPSLYDMFESKIICPVDELVENHTDFVDLGDKYKIEFSYDETLDFKTINVKVENDVLYVTFSQEGNHVYRDFSYSHSIPELADVHSAKSYKENGKIVVTFYKKISVN